MLNLILIELGKTFRKWRTWIGFMAIGVIVPLSEIGLRASGDALIGSVTKSLSGGAIPLVNPLNGFFVTVFLMNSLWVHIPFLITLGAGDQIAGEATGGTFRLILTRPVSRTKILLSKYVTTLIYTTLLVLFLGLLSLTLGVLLLGTGDLLVLVKGFSIIPRDDALWRIIVAFLCATWGMWCVASLTFLFSSLVENAIGPIVGTMAVIIVFLVISGLPVSFFTAIRPYIFTTYLSFWERIMDQPVPWTEVARCAAILGGFIVGFFGITWYIFVRKDILS